MSVPKVLSIAGSDPSAGAGLQVDLKTFAAHGCYGMSAVTALTAQNTMGVQGVHIPPAEFLAQQIETIFSDIQVDAVKIGMIGNEANVHVIVDALERHKPAHIVLDPVMVASSGDVLFQDGTIEAMKERLIPLSTIITPNKPEAQILGSEDAAELLSLGAQAVLVKGGHDDGEHAVDVLATSDGVQQFSAPRIDTQNTHGTGCTLSSAIVANLAKGMDLPEAVGVAKDYITGAIAGADALEVGSGHGPVHHFHGMWD